MQTIDSRYQRRGRADIHVHTTHSDGRDDPASVVQHAVRVGLDVLAITDHDTIAGAEIAADLALREEKPEVIVGEEVSSLDGHILGLFLHRRIAPDMSARATIEAIHEQGGIAIAAHPYWVSRNSRGVGNLCLGLPFDAIEVINGGFTPAMIRANQAAERLSAGSALALAGGSDAHVAHAIGWAYTGFQGSTAADLRAAFLAASTVPRRGTVGAMGVARYVMWGLELRPRMRQVTA